MPKKYVRVRVPLGDKKAFYSVIRQKEKAGYLLDFAYQDVLGFVFVGKKAIKRMLMEKDL